MPRHFLNRRLHQPISASLPADSSAILEALRPGLMDLISQHLQASTGAPESEQTQVQAKTDFRDWAQSVAWYRRLETTLNIFSYYFEWVAFSEPDEVTELIDDLVYILSQLALDAAAIRAEQESGEDVSASKLGQPVKTVIQLGGLELVQGSSSNDQPFEGVLCTLDSVSENTPAVGPGMPLYISSEVAKKALLKVAGLPLDVDETLEQHNNEGVVGVMMSGSIAGPELRVKGHLWGWNCPDKVAAIRNNQKELGMSMNATTWGHPDTIDGVRAYRVTKLELLGANILKKDCATYQQTAVVTAGTGQDNPAITTAPAVPVAASSTNPDNGENQTMPMDPELRNELTSITSSLGSVAQGIEGLSNQLGEVNQVVNSNTQQLQLQNDRLSALEQRNADADAVAAQNRQAQEAKDQAKEQAKTIKQLAAQALQDMINPNGVPARITTPIAAGAGDGGAAPTASDRDIQIATIQGSIDALKGRHDPVSRQQRMDLRDKLRNLQSPQSPALTLVPSA